MDAPARSTSWVVVLLAWVVVALPLGWGLYQSVMKSRPLFEDHASQPAKQP